MTTDILSQAREFADHHPDGSAYHLHVISTNSITEVVSTRAGFETSDDRKPVFFNPAHVVAVVVEFL